MRCGGPIFNEAGFAVALVEGGRPGTETNDLIPIAPAIALLKKHGVQAGSTRKYRSTFLATQRVPPERTAWSGGRARRIGMQIRAN